MTRIGPARWLISARILTFSISTDAVIPALGRDAVARVATRGSLLAGLTIVAPADAAISARWRGAVLGLATPASVAHEVHGRANLCGAAIREVSRTVV